MKKNVITSVVLTFMALVFTIGLTFTAAELPKLADNYLGKLIKTPQLATGRNQETQIKTDLYLKHYRLRTIGYMALAITLALIITGFIANKKRMSSAGAILLFLPVFGHFAATMFFLGGLAFFRLIWLPFLDLSFDIMRLGEIVLLPYRVILDIFSKFGLNIDKPLPFIITGTGLFIFLAGTLVWFYSKIKKQTVADFWIYKISRHPQYLGWIIWSYGIMFLPGVNMRRSFEISSTLPWLLSTMVIIAVALFEEFSMERKDSTAYRQYQKKAPFMFPLPKMIGKLIKSPLRIFYKTSNIIEKKHILSLVGFYTLIMILLSGWYSGMFSQASAISAPPVKNIPRVVQKINRTSSRITIRKQLKLLSNMGKPAIPSLLALLKSNSAIIRWYTIDVLGKFNSDQVIDALITCLEDPHHWVRNASARALANLKSKKAVPHLIQAFSDPKKKMEVTSARALGSIGDKRALEPLGNALLNKPRHIAAGAADGLAYLGDPKAISFLLQCLEERPDCPGLQVGNALLQFNSNRAIEAFKIGLEDEKWWIRSESLHGLSKLGSEKAHTVISGALEDSDFRVRMAAVRILSDIKDPRFITPLKKMLKDPNFEIRIYAREGLRQLEKTKN